MKKIILTAAIVFIAQSMFVQIAIMPEVGLNLSNMSMKDNSGGPTASYKNKIGWKIGTSFLLPVGKSFFIQPGLFFTTKGTRDSYKESFGGFNYSYNFNLNTNYLEMPINMGYMNDLGNAGSLFFTAGPYLGLGLSGKAWAKGYVNGVLDPSSSDEADAFGEYGYMKKIDLGLNFGIGYKLPFGVFARTQYGISLLNLSKDADVTFRNKGFSFSAGYIYTFKAPAKSKVKTGVRQ